MEMDDPTKVYGQKIGRVRVGDKWMPAILESSEGDSGLRATRCECCTETSLCLCQMDMEGTVLK